MAFGRFAVNVPSANTDTVIYTVPDNCSYAEVHVNILNPDTTDATVQLAIAATDTPSANEYIEKGAILPSNGGILERADMICSPGERIIVRSTLATSVVRVSGKQIIET